MSSSTPFKHEKNLDRNTLKFNKYKYKTIGVKIPDQPIEREPAWHPYVFKISRFIIGLQMDDDLL